ncbi:MAG: BatA domain-containing protein, partial [Pseudomonadota bacterium]
MVSLGPIVFLTPLLLIALAALPILWWLLRAVPPAPAKRAFPGVRLLLGLFDPERQAAKTPWWLLALRIAALAAAILGFSNPVMNPEAEATGSGPLLIAMDGGWASAPTWAERQARVGVLLDQAARSGRPAHLVQMTEGALPEGGPAFQDPGAWAARIAGLSPAPWAPDRGAVATWLDTGAAERFETVWLTDGIAREGDAAFIDALSARGPVTVIRDGLDKIAVTAPSFSEGAVRADILRLTNAPRPSLRVTAFGPDPNGIERVLGETRVLFEGAGTETEAVLEMPVELRNRITRLVLPGLRSAGAVALTDDGLKRRKVALLSGGQEDEAARLVSPLYYLRRALEPSADLIEAPLTDALLAAPDVVVLADVGTLAGPERDALATWIEGGGVLVRFAGPRLAQSGQGQLEEDPLLPVRLRAGGRTVGGTMSWGAPKQLRPFPESSPFFGLALPADVAVSSQVMAQPDPNLPERVMAALEDGTPLVTGRSLGEGRVVLFHV